MKILKKITSSLVAMLLLFSATFSYGAKYTISGTRTLPDGSITETTFENVQDQVFYIENGANLTFAQPTTFNNNRYSAYSSAAGGVLCNSAHSSSSTVTTFNNKTIFKDNIIAISSNSYSSASAYGGAIYNNANSYSNATITFNDLATFEGNIAQVTNTNSSAYTYGGAIYNYAYYYNSNATITFNDLATFEGNTAQSTSTNSNPYAYGGAIYNYANSSSSNAQITFNGRADFKNNTAKSEYTGSSSYYSYAYGGAIYNYASSSSSNAKIIFNDLATFEGNTAESKNAYYYPYAYGGAIYNYANNNNSNAQITFNGKTDFKNNTAKSEYTGSSTYSSYAYGGAIYNYASSSYSNATITFNDLATFEGNIAQATTTGNPTAYGGAIYNYADYSNANQTITFNDGAIFRNNKAIATTYNTGYGTNARGGAIYNYYGTINLVAKTNDVLFEGNKTQNSSGSGSNNGDAIYNEQGTINLWASDNASIIFNDSVYSSGWDSSRGININKPNSDGRPTTGTIYFNAENNYLSCYMHVYGGTIKVGENGSFTGDNWNSLYFYVDGDTTLDLVNNKVQKDFVYRFRGDNDLYLKLDVDSQNNVSDMFRVYEMYDDVRIVIDDINLVDTTLENVKEFEVPIFEFEYDENPIVVLSEGVKEKFHLDLPEGTKRNEEVTKNTAWNKVFHVQEGYAIRDLEVEDYTIKLKTKGTWRDTEEVMGDTLNLVNALETNSQKTFNFDSANNEYVSTDNAGETKGSLKINGVSNGNEKSTINFNDNEGFVVNEDATLNVKNTKFTGNDVAITLNEGTLKLSNVYTEESKLNLNGGLVQTNKDKITEKYYVKDLTKDTEIQIDVNPEQNTSDSFNIENANATLTITKLNTIGQKGSFSVNVLEGANVNLEVSQDIMDRYNYEISGIQEQQVTEDTLWTDVFYLREGWETSELSTEGGKLELNIEGEWENLEALGDTLYLVSTSSAVEDKNFNFETAEDVYTFNNGVGQSSGTMTVVGNVTLNGVQDGEKMSTIDLNKVGSFEVLDGELNINNVRIVNSTSTAIRNSGTVNIENAVFENNNKMETYNYYYVTTEPAVIMNGYNEWEDPETGDYKWGTGTITFTGTTLIQNNNIDITSKGYDVEEYSRYEIEAGVYSYGSVIYNDYQGKIIFDGNTEIKNNETNLTAIGGSMKGGLGDNVFRSARISSIGLICNILNSEMIFNETTKIEGNITNLTANSGSFEIEELLYSDNYFYGGCDIGSYGAIINANDATMIFNNKTIFENNETNIKAVDYSLVSAISNTDNYLKINGESDLYLYGSEFSNVYDATTTFNDDTIFKNNKNNITKMNGNVVYRSEITSTSNSNRLQDRSNSYVEVLGTTVYNNYNSKMVFNKTAEFENNVATLNVLGSERKYEMCADKENSSTKNINVNIRPRINITEAGTFMNTNMATVTFNDDVKFKNNSMSANVIGDTITAKIDARKVNDIRLYDNDIESEINIIIAGGALINGASTAKFNKSVEFENNNVFAQATGSTINANIQGIDYDEFYISATTSLNTLGGAVLNLAGITDFEDQTVFRNNSVESIATPGQITRGTKTEVADTVSQALGGAVLNFSSEMTFNDNAIFENNSARATIIDDDVKASTNTSTLAAGGAVFNMGMDIYGDYGSTVMTFNKNVKFKDNSSEVGGAVVVAMSTMTVKGDAVFKGNKATSNKEGKIKYSNFYNSYYGETVELPVEYGTGGAIANIMGQVEISGSAEFENNEANYGGAIANVGYFEEREERYYDEYSYYNDEEDMFANIGVITISDGARFVNNKAENLGGAIYNVNGTINLTAVTNDIIFEGNTAGDRSNAIYDDHGVINIKVLGNTKAVFNDAIESANEDSVLNINVADKAIRGTTARVSSEQEYGTIILNADMSQYTGTVNIGNGTIKLGEDAQWFGGDVNIATVTLDMINSKIDRVNIGNAKVSNKLYIKVDVDLSNEEMDTLEFESFVRDTNKRTIEVTEFNLISDSKEEEVTITFSDTIKLYREITTDVKEVVSAEDGHYEVTYNGDGTFTFVQTKAPRPKRAPATVTDIVKVGGYIMQSNVMNQVFSSIEEQDMAQKKGEITLESGMWIRPFAMKETVRIGETDVKTDSYGTLAGIDIKATDRNTVSLYVGVAGSKEEVSKLKVDQIGYVFGASAVQRGDNWYIGATANVGTNKVTAQDDKVGTDEYNMLTYSVGLKAVYDLALNEMFSIEPGITAWYGGANSNKYDSERLGCKVDSMYNKTIEVKPVVRVKTDLGLGWKPYALIGYAFNLGDEAEESQDRQVDQLGKGYTEFGLGLNKTFGKSISVYLQGTGRYGSRDGYGGDAGIKYAF